MLQTNLIMKYTIEALACALCVAALYTNYITMAL